MNPTFLDLIDLASERLGAAAVRAKDETGPDVDRVREALQLFIRLRGHARTPARLFSPDRAALPPSEVAGDVKDLPGLVHAARSMAHSSP